MSEAIKLLHGMNAQRVTYVPATKDFLLAWHANIQELGLPQGDRQPPYVLSSDKYVEDYPFTTLMKWMYPCNLTRTLSSNTLTSHCLWITAAILNHDHVKQMGIFFTVLLAHHKYLGFTDSMYIRYQWILSQHSVYYRVVLMMHYNS